MMGGINDERDKGYLILFFDKDLHLRRLHQVHLRPSSDVFVTFIYVRRSTPSIPLLHIANFDTLCSTDKPRD